METNKRPVAKCLKIVPLLELALTEVGRSKNFHSPHRSARDLRQGVPLASGSDAERFTVSGAAMIIVGWMVMRGGQRETPR